MRLFVASEMRLGFGDVFVASTSNAGMRNDFWNRVSKGGEAGKLSWQSVRGLEVTYCELVVHY